ncbi:MAG TPA: LysR family transcriptional regulator [Actinocrinis sp.]|nr:LysR family transcriptional regulator [Actinocrinis sp.]
MIDPRHLKTLRALADHGTVTAAASALHLTPSAVSQQLTALAKSTGCTLLEPHGRRVLLTQPAKILLDHADAIMERYEHVESDLREFRQGAVARMRIASFSTAISGFVAATVAMLGRDEAGWRVEIEEAESEESIALLLDRDVDLAVVMIAPNRPLLADRRLHLEPLLDDRYQAVVPADHPLAAAGVVGRLADLAEEPWVLSRTWTSCHEIVAGACAAAGFQPRADHYTTDFSASVSMVEAGLGVTVIPELGLPLRLPDSVRALRIEENPPHRRIAAAVRRGSSQPELLSALRKAIVDRGFAGAASEVVAESEV